MLVFIYRFFCVFLVLSWGLFLSISCMACDFSYINKNALTELTKLMGRYDKAPEKAKIKLANRIQRLIDNLDPNIKGDLALIPNRLDKPMVGGVTFRGDDDDNLKDMSLTHTCTGSNGVAFQKIVLNHQ